MISAQKTVQECILVGDLYHWEMDKDGYFVVQQNSSREAVHPGEKYFFTFDLDKITQNIVD